MTALFGWRVGTRPNDKICGEAIHPSIGEAAQCAHTTMISDRK